MAEEKVVLVVDDNPAIRELLNDFLKKEGFRVFGAPNGSSALEFMKGRRCDVVITDYSMPEMDGVALIKKLRPLYPHLFIIGTSGFCDEKDFLSAGANVFLPKPFRLHDLLSIFQSYSYIRHCEMIKRAEEK
ncbi:MAG: response regulator [Nitrospirota bacterium]